MATLKSIAALLAMGLSASAWAAGRDAESNRSLDSLNQPVVQRTDFVLDLATDGSGLAGAERQRLDAWFASLGVGYGDHVWVEEPYRDSRAREDVAAIAADYGLLLSQGSPVTTGRIQPGGIRVIVGRSSASVPGCPNYGHSGASATSPNYGCAVNSNLAAMIADPTDLVLGQAGSGTGNADTAAKAIKVYRDTPPTGTKGLTETQTRGNR